MISARSLVRPQEGPPELGCRGCSSAGRAPALQAGGWRFESAHLHHRKRARVSRALPAMLFDNRIGRFSSDSQAIVLRGQATKGERWMPWRQEATKGVASCDKPRGAASRHRSGDARMGKPGRGNARSSEPESIGFGSEPGELKHLSTSRKRKKTRFPE